MPLKMQCVNDRICDLTGSSQQFSAKYEWNRPYVLHCEMVFSSAEDNYRRIVLDQIHSSFVGYLIETPLENSFDISKTKVV